MFGIGKIKQKNKMKQYKVLFPFQGKKNKSLIKGSTVQSNEIVKVEDAIKKGYIKECAAPKQEPAEEQKKDDKDKKVELTMFNKKVIKETDLSNGYSAEELKEFATEIDMLADVDTKKEALVVIDKWLNA